jgi:hypothetical protein
MEESQSVQKKQTCSYVFKNGNDRKTPNARHVHSHKTYCLAPPQCVLWECSYCAQRLQESLPCSVLNPPTFWDDVVFMGLQQWGGKTMKAYFCRLVFGSTIYNIWKNKNALRHGIITKEKLIKQTGS